MLVRFSLFFVPRMQAFVVAAERCLQIEATGRAHTHTHTAAQHALYTERLLTPGTAAVACGCPTGRLSMGESCVWRSGLV